MDEFVILNNMKKIEKIKEILKKSKSTLKEKFKVKELAIFGSYVRGEQKKRSDLDILIDFEQPISLFEFLDLEEFLEKLLKMKVDLVMKDSLKPRIGKHILREMNPV